MKPVNEPGKYVLSGNNGLIAYAGNDKTLQLNLTGIKGSFRLKFVTLADGTVTDNHTVVEGGKKVNIDMQRGSGIVWLER